MIGAYVKLQGLTSAAYTWKITNIKKIFDQNECSAMNEWSYARISVPVNIGRQRSEASEPAEKLGKVDKIILEAFTPQQVLMGLASRSGLVYHF